MKFGSSGFGAGAPSAWGGDPMSTENAALRPAQQQFDTELGQIFLKMRTLLGMTLWDMARAVGSEPTVIANLEAGAIAALPPWPDLVPLIEGYAHLTGIDPQPIVSRLLRSIPAARPDPGLHTPRTITAEPSHRNRYQPQPQRSQAPYGTAHARQVVSRQPSQLSLQQGASAYLVEAHPVAIAAPTQRRVSRSPALATPAELVQSTKRSAGQHLARAAQSMVRGSWRAIKRWRTALIVLVALPGLFAVTARAAPSILYTIVSPFPRFIATPLRAGLDQLVTAMAPVRDGLTWIDIGNPEARKSDRLPGPATETGR